MEVDRLAHIQSAAPEFITKSFYGQVNYFLVYKYKDQEKMLAKIKWTSNVNEDPLGTTFFISEDGPTQFIDVTAINRCVGFMKLERKTYIIDKECMEEW
jgi:hypothetical protein